MAFLSTCSLHENLYLGPLASNTGKANNQGLWGLASSRQPHPPPPQLPPPLSFVLCPVLCPSLREITVSSLVIAFPQELSFQCLSHDFQGFLCEASQSCHECCDINPRPMHVEEDLRYLMGFPKENKREEGRTQSRTLSALTEIQVWFPAPKPNDSNYLNY